MNATDTTLDGAGPYPRGQLPALRRRINNALAAADTDPGNDRVRDALESYVAGPDGIGATILLNSLQAVVGPDAAYEALGMEPPMPGLVYCCATLGWVTPAEAAEHSYDSGFGMDLD